MFAMVVYFNVRYMYLDVARAQLSNMKRPQGDPHYLSKNDVKIVWAADFLNCISFCISSLIFVIRPHNIDYDQSFDYPLWHTVSFIQLVLCQYIAYVANMWSTSNETHIDGCWIFLAFFGVICTGFATCGLTQMIMYDQATSTPGPIPWWVTAFFDYAWFACMALQGHFRPRAPSIQVAMDLSPDDDCTLPGYTTIGNSAQASMPS